MVFETKPNIRVQEGVKSVSAKLQERFSNLSNVKSTLEKWENIYIDIDIDIDVHAGAHT